MINIQKIDDNESFKWCLDKFLHLANYHPAKIGKVDKDLARKRHFENIKLPVKIRDIHKIKKIKITSALGFLIMKIRENIKPMFKTNALKKDMLIYLLLIEER